MVLVMMFIDFHELGMKTDLIKELKSKKMKHSAPVRRFSSRILKDSEKIKIGGVGGGGDSWTMLQNG